MKKFKIPVIDKNFIIYSGKEEYKKWQREIHKNGCKVKEEDYPGEFAGRAWGGWIWVGNLKHRKLLLHEVSHFVYELIVDLGAEQEEEFFAYISAYVYDEALKYMESVK